MRMNVIRKNLGIVFLAMLLISIFSSCEIDAGIPDRNTISDTYDVKIKTVMEIKSKGLYYCWTDGLNYDKSSESFVGSGYVAYIESNNRYRFWKLGIYKDSKIVCAKYGLRTWADGEVFFEDLNIYNNEVSFASKEFKVHEFDDKGEHAPNYMVKISCERALLAE